MKTFNFIQFIFIAVSLTLHGQESTSFKPFGQHSDLLAKGDMRYSLFTKGEYGISDKLTIRLHPLWIFMAPSIDVKWQWKKSEKRSVSFVHGISSPTPGMSLFAMEGTGGLISPEFDIPFMLSVRNGMISTWKLKNEHRVTSELGVEFALLNDKLQPGSSIDLPIISPRNAVYYKNFGIDAGLTAEGKILGRIDYYSKVQGFIFPAETSEYEQEYGKTGKIFGEATALIFWNISKKCKFGLGTKLCYGEYPFGNQWHLLPFFDFVRYSRK